ncbi:HypC/HybG/HupF family hydrogenase formation chaperone [Synechococcus sp. BA-132 BA5]|uniref:HypC/HybG/HupF family hydrogenase formation chaperone n=1 Tax=Synechococcus sp. BA-132 BA5 TaxID=3110252 RepID=UPI002B1F8578|nr:HypC/HybG/HupF family hydrogenase formation chaperone [Synechococcus sp. BA-132 BA5]MEA5417244.1 HypC/HybG/HupF family hydrogenase formation chaperone [Synechococcus sp. BA-132 BA5]
MPARILSIRIQPPPGAPEPAGAAAADDLWRMAEVDFGGVRQQVSLACLPEAAVGDRVLVHVGLALSLVDDEPA